MKQIVLTSVGRTLLVSFGVLLVTFALVRLLPGDPVEILLGDTGTPEQIREYRELLGLHQPPVKQFLQYVGDVFRGDLGVSLVTRQPVASVIWLRLPVTLWLVGLTLIMSLALACPLGVLAAVYRHTWFGLSFRIGTSVLIATPVYFSGLVMVILLSMRLDLMPVAGYVDGFPGNLRYLCLPALVLCGRLAPILARVLQSSVSDTLEQEFVETAVVRGLPRRIFYWRYLLRPSLAPTLALASYITGVLLGATVLIELIFTLPGMGTALVDAVLRRDYTMVQGIVLVLGMCVVAISFASELVCGWLDPRTRIP